MFKEIELLTAEEVAELKRIAASSQFVDGRQSNPTSKVKQNLQLHEPKAYEQSAGIVLQAMRRNEELNRFVLPVAVAPPLLARYTPGMRYGDHHDMAYLQFATVTMRSDVSCTVFLNDPSEYDGGALCIHLGSENLRFRCKPGNAIFYPSSTLHEVEEVTRGERLVSITFIQSRVADPFHREMLYEMNEVAELEGLGMKHENLVRLQFVHQTLLRHWGDKP